MLPTSETLYALRANQLARTKLSSPFETQENQFPFFTECTQEPVSLVGRFITASGIILICGMTLFGTWVSNRIDQGVLQNYGHSIALSMESFLEPLVQDLADKPDLSTSSLLAIDEFLSHADVRQRVSSIELWRADGTILYPKGKASDDGPASEALMNAYKGEVQIERFKTDGPNVAELAPKQQLLRVFAPIHQFRTGRILSVAGYLEPGINLEAELRRAQRDTFLVVAAFTMGIFTILYLLVRRACQLLTFQHRSLVQRYSEQVRLNALNAELRIEQEHARREGIEINERFLRRVGSDLHDGPAQLLALAMLRLDDVAPVSCAEESPAHLSNSRVANALDTVRSATVDALGEIRSICSGLALPELRTKTPTEAITDAVIIHERSTRTVVHCNIGYLPSNLPTSSMVCLFRFVQEGLNNAFRHAGGRGQSLTTHCDGSTFEVAISDHGTGFDPDEVLTRTERLGLAGLRHRIEAIGGTMEVVSAPGKGTRLRATFPNNIGRDCHA